MNVARELETKDQILQQFGRLQDVHRRRLSRIATKEEEAVQTEDRAIVDAASAHTVENIVKGLADLQLTFDRVIEDTAQRLESESDLLGQMRRAIEVETQRLAHLKEIQIAADALDILRQEQDDQVRQFEQNAAEERSGLEHTVEDAHEKWAREALAFKQAVMDEDQATQRAREQEVADHDYNLKRRLQMEADAFAQRTRQVEREQAEEGEIRAADWSERRAILKAESSQYKADTARIEAFPALLEQTRKTAREEAIKKTDRQARTEAELLEEEVKSNRKVYAFQIETLESKIARYDEEIAQLESRLSAAQKQAQDLAAQALSTPTPVLD